MFDAVKATSRMERRLSIEIARARSSLEADCKRAELAAYRARLGYFQQASDALAVLRQKNQHTREVLLSAWIHLAQGILSYFSDVGVSKTDGVQRAHALCLAAGLHQLRSTCAAWLAQWDYSRVDMEALSSHVREALQAAGSENHSARSRANLVGAQALHVSGRPDLAQIWYRRSREHAIADCDDATISALMHNMAWLRMLCMRQLVFTGRGDVGAGRHAMMNAESNAHFDEMVGDSSWHELKPILRAQIVSLQGDAAAALALYQEHLAEAMKAARLQAYLLADKAWCHAQVGHLDEARNTAQLAIQSLTEETHVDDRAAAHSRLAHTFSLIGDASLEQSHLALAESDWADHCTMQVKAVELLSRVCEDGSTG